MAGTIEREFQLAKAKTKPAAGNAIARHLSHHSKFYAGLLAAIIAFAAAWNERLPVQMLAAGDAFFAVYLLLVLSAVIRSTPDSMMEHSRYEDEGLFFVATLTFTAVLASLGAIILLLFTEDLSRLEVGLALAALPLGWLTTHAAFAVHYARLFHYSEDGKRSRGGLDFPGEDDPDLADFLYFSFVIGMTAQTSDIGITEKPIRRLALFHGIVSFFYNTVIVALSVNAAVQAAG
jgi:uncharacterized membrane protein